MKRKMKINANANENYFLKNDNKQAKVVLLLICDTNKK